MADEDRKAGAGNQKSKDDEGGSVRLAKNPYIVVRGYWRTRLNPTDVGKAHLRLSLPYISGHVSS